MTITILPHNRGGTQVSVDGHILAIITEATDRTALTKFITLCQENDATLGGLAAEAETRRQWNYDHPGQGRDWPAFRNLERFLSKLLSTAGVKDS